MQTRYLIVGSSHAALSALHAIRMTDSEGGVTLVTRDARLPYSPTVLPYVVSGRSDPARVFLRDADYFRDQKVDYLPGAALAALRPDEKTAVLGDGRSVSYEKLLLATGATPVIPPVDGLSGVPYHVLRTLDDAVRLHQAMPGVRDALVLGGGLIGMHAAENLARTGAKVAVVEAEAHVLSAYFDADASGIIETAFAANGVDLHLASRAVSAGRDENGRIRLALGGGRVLGGDLLLVATGVAPAIACVTGCGIECDQGILVDERMRTSVENVWAAGDVAQARDFFGNARVLNGILPDAVEQGRIAGMQMAGDPAANDYPGGVPLNTYSFFGKQALSVGTDGGTVAGAEVHKSFEPHTGRYMKIVMRDDRLLGIFAIDRWIDAGVMWELILRRIDLGPVKAEFLADPQRAARVLMSKTWR
jgi:phenylglyoxylate dehydrogenase epsilon subunit